MKAAKHDVTGLGNAIVDVLSQVEDPFLARHQLAKGTMTLIDRAQADSLYSEVQNGVEQSGGSAANTMAGIASLGGNGAYIGKVGSDALGRAFTADMRKVGTHFETHALEDGDPTARCLVWVTPDAQRTMATYLGACTELGPEDVELEVVADSKITYLEGYLWDKPRAKEAVLCAAKAAHESGHKVALTLSDAFCVDRHRDEFRALLKDHIDILFANEAEIQSLFQGASFEEAVDAVRDQCEIAALTRSAKGSVIVEGKRVSEIPAAPIAKVVDTTGAGDLYAAGFLYGLSRGRPTPDCGELGSLCAAEIISHFGARPESPLRDWIAQRR